MNKTSHKVCTILSILQNLRAFLASIWFNLAEWPWLYIMSGILIMRVNSYFVTVFWEQERQNLEQVSKFWQSSIYLRYLCDQKTKNKFLMILAEGFAIWSLLSINCDNGNCSNQNLIIFWSAYLQPQQTIYNPAKPEVKIIPRTLSAIYAIFCKFK